MSFEPPGECPICGEYVEEGAVACGGCGSCAETGWNEDTLYDGLDLPDGSDRDPRESRESKVWGTVVSLALLGLLVYVFVFR
ncbi:hypothetical protein VDG1235_1292 [Verrucomicrobiia bacterium DG1235]|nr:hypothetical protein VDG1235_1292 [Verrucomicrobiae bacterium DG1235]